MKVTSFRDKVCWITGASSGIGAALAIALNQLGAHLILSARSTKNLERVKSTCIGPGKVVLLPCDMEEICSLPGMVMKSWEAFNGIDYVFLNAGFAVRDLVINTEFEMINKIMTINFFSTAVISKSLLPLMKEKGSGHFVVTSSLSGKYGVPKLAAYSASKHALHGYFESFRAENEGAGIKVTMIIPGFVKTNISINALRGDGELYGKMMESIANGISPEKCANEIIREVAHEKKEALIGGMEKYSVLIKRLFPRFFSSAIKNHPLKKLRMLGFFKKRRQQV